MFTLYKPSIEDLWFRAQMMGNEQTMAYNHAYGGTIPFPKSIGRIGMTDGWQIMMINVFTGMSR